MGPQRASPRARRAGRRFLGAPFRLPQEPGRTSLPDRILTAAHHYASGWEYNVIKPFNTFDEENQSIAESFTERLDGLTDLCGVNELIQGHAFFSDSPTALGRFAKLCGQLRFQIRWADTPRAARKPPCSGTCSSLRVTAIFLQPLPRMPPRAPDQQLLRRTVPRSAGTAHAGHHHPGQTLRKPAPKPSARLRTTRAGAACLRPPRRRGARPAGGTPPLLSRPRR